MALTDLLLSNALVSALGWSLVHFVWQGCVIAAVYWLVCVLSRPESVHFRYWSGVTGFCLTIVTLITTFIIYYEPAAEFSAVAATQSSVDSFLVLSGSVPDAWGLLQDGIEPALPFVVLLWLAGVVVSSVRTTREWLGLRRLVAVASEDIGDELRELLEGLMQTLGVRQSVRVLKSSVISVPMALGWFRPVILLPASVLTRLPTDQLEMVIAHELGHIRRYDYLVNLFQVVIENLLFFHPAIGWMSRSMREYRESCCDDLVVARCRKPATYARALANLEVVRSPQSGPTMVTAMAATGGNLFGRIKRIVDSELPRTPSGYAQLSLLAVVALCSALGAQQGMLLSKALNQVAASVHVQASDVEWKAWRESRSAWSSGIDGFAGLQSVTASVSEIQSARVKAEKTQRRNASPEHPVAADTRESDVAVSPMAVKPLAPVEKADIKNDPPIIASLLVAAVPTISLPVDGLTAPAETHWLAKSEQVVNSPVAETREADLRLSPTKTVEPRYPWRARARGQEGFVKLAFNINEKGKVTDISVLDSIPEGVFDRAAEKALKRWKFPTGSVSSSEKKLVQTFDFELDKSRQADQRAARMRRNCAVTGRRTCSRAASAAVIVYVNPPAKRTAPIEAR